MKRLLPVAVALLLSVRAFAAPPAETAAGPPADPTTQDTEGPSDTGDREQPGSEHDDAEEQPDGDGEDDATDREPPGDGEDDATEEEADGAGEDDATDREPPGDGEDDATEEEADGAGNERSGRSEDIDVLGEVLDVSRVAGAAQVVNEETLERQEHDDVHRVLAGVPGVYLRDEDGYGLRPNIGIRGANSDRSSKVTLMEDGVLMAPAPYSAPAAYYFPLVTRMTGMEVFKGPAAVRYGPNTVGGALNLVTAPVPLGHRLELDAAVGSNRSWKLHGRAGVGNRRMGVLVEAVHLETDGFKVLDGGGPTGFDKNEVMLKAFVAPGDPEARLRHRIELKGSYADERSHETYLGLSDEDFAVDPYRRYAASARGLMTWKRTQLQVRYRLEIGDTIDLTATGYRHDFARVWEKLNGFSSGPEIGAVLASPDSGANAVWAAILRGEQNSSSADEALAIGINNRAFVSEGVQLIGRWRSWKGDNYQNLELGLRLHRDETDRLHTARDYLMVDKELVDAEGATRVDKDSRAGSVAFSAWVLDEIGLGPVLLNPGLRLEVIRTELIDHRNGDRAEGRQAVLLPGFGVLWNIDDAWSVLAGAHRGFSPVSPGQAAEVQPESSVNIEAGGRIRRESFRAEMIGFFNSYSNLTGECTQSSGCGDELLNDQFNGGAVSVYGLEATVDHRFGRVDGFSVETSLAYTLTLSRFRSDFVSPHPQFGSVRRGDRLAYVPEHQGSFALTLLHPRFSVGVSAAMQSAMRDVPGRGPIRAHERIDPRMVIDLSSSVQPIDEIKVYLNVANLFNSRYMASRRPFGARPGKPFSVTLGLKLRLPR